MKKRITSTLLSLILILTLCCGMTGTAFAGTAGAVPVSTSLSVDGKALTLNGYTIEGYNFFSLRDIAYAVNGSEKQFNITYDASKDAVSLLSGTAYAANGSELQPLSGSEKTAKTAAAGLYKDGQKIIYTLYTVDGASYIRLNDAFQIFNIRGVYDDAKKSVTVSTDQDYTVNFKRTAESGYFDFLHGAVLGNADTGEILYSSNGDQQVSIASTSKIMTYLLVREAIDAGSISWDDDVVLSKNAEANSLSEDGVIPMKAGQKIKLRELMNTMLIVSSNESATALAEHVAGSEAEFTKRMNARAKELGLTSADFYNPHGLPTYTADVLSAKRQNRMSAKDLFELSRYTINKYPDILEIAEKTSYTAEQLKYTGENTNRLLFQMVGVDGLKTGTTNRAGCCLVGTMPVQNGDKTTRVIAVVLGAEDSMERAEKTGTLLQYAKEYYSK